MTANGVVKEAIILAAGRGTRLGPSAEGGPKCLVSVAGRSILEWQLNALHCAGVRRVVVVVGFQAERVSAALEPWRDRLEIVIASNPRFATTNVLASWLVGSALLGEDHLYLHGDTVFEPALITRLLSAPSKAQVVLSVDRHPCAEEEMKVQVDGDRVIAVNKQMEGAAADGEFTGIALVRSAVLRLLRERAEELIQGPDGNKLFFEAVLSDLMARGELVVNWLDITGVRWREIDFVEDLEAANVLLAGRG